MRKLKLAGDIVPITQFRVASFVIRYWGGTGEFKGEREYGQVYKSS